jgi:queuine/archaeosine tRNA-ribosyltransferase
LYYDSKGQVKLSNGKIPSLNDAPVVAYTCSTEKGACAAPVWSLRTGKPRLVGFHVATDNTLNFFIPLSSRLRQRIAEGKSYSN